MKDAARYGRNVWLLLVIFGISLFSVEIFPSSLPITIVLADVVIGLLLVYSLIQIGRFTLSPISYATFALAVVILSSGIVNIWRDVAFDIGNFAANYIRIFGLVAMVFLLPPLLRKIGHHNLATATMWVVRLQCVLILADAISLLPDVFSFADWLPRPTGLFGEPGWFGIWLGLSIFYVTQVQCNFKRRYISFYDICLVGISVIASTGMSGVVLVGFALVVLLISVGLRARFRLLSGILLTLALVVFTANLFPNSGLAWNWDYVAGRGQHLLPFNLTDGSTTSRISQSTRVATIIIDDAPLFGTGLGGSAKDRFESRYSDPELPDLPAASSNSGLTGVLRAAGFPALLLLFFIIARMIFVAETRYVGVGFAVVAVIFGGIFSSFIWWNIALAISLVGTRREVASKPTQPRELHAVDSPTMPVEPTS